MAHNACSDYKPVLVFSKVKAQLHTATDVLDWIKRTLGVELKTLKKLCTGAIFCAILNKHFPDSIQMSRVHREARNKVQSLSNFKLMEAALTKLGVSKNIINVEKLLNGDPEATLQFAIWLKLFTEANCMRESKVPIRGKSETRPLNKMAIGARLLDTRCRPRSRSVAEVFQRLANLGDELPDKATNESGGRRVAGAFVSKVPVLAYQGANRSQLKGPKQSCSNKLNQKANINDRDRRRPKNTVEGSHSGAPLCACAPAKHTVFSANTDASPAKWSRAQLPVISHIDIDLEEIQTRALAENETSSPIPSQSNNSLEM